MTGFDLQRSHIMTWITEDSPLGLVENTGKRESPEVLSDPGALKAFALDSCSALLAPGPSTNLRKALHHDRVNERHRVNKRDRDTRLGRASERRVVAPVGHESRSLEPRLRQKMNLAILP